MFYFSREKIKLQQWHFCHMNHKSWSKPVLRSCSTRRQTPDRLFSRSATLPSCFLGADIHQEMNQPQWPHLLARQPTPPRKHPKGRTGLETAQGVQGGVCPGQETCIKEKQCVGTFNSVDALLRHWPSILTQAPWKKIKETDLGQELKFSWGNLENPRSEQLKLSALPQLATCQWC